MALTETVVRATLQAVGVVLPISESAHRALGEVWLGPDAARSLPSLAAHLGSLLALAFVTRARLWAACLAVGRGLRRPRLRASTDSGRDAQAVVLAAAISLGLERLLAAPVARLQQQPLVVGAGLCATAAMLALTPLAPSPRALAPGPLGAAVVGLAHGLGSVPGASQVGAAFVVLSWLGVRGWRAVEIGLMVSVPTLTIAVVRESAGLLGSGLLLSAAMAAALGVAALAAWLGASTWRLLGEGNRPLLFLGWIVPLAIAMLGYARATAL
jgi:undecaprenyl pyrophosphate phosphatase UppP